MARKLVSFDWAVKRLLRSKANFVVLEGFLSELLKEDIVILEVLESESDKDIREQHQTRVDLLVKNQEGILIIIEVQADRQDDYLHRILYGVSKCIVENLPQGGSYHQIKKVISVSVVATINENGLVSAHKTGRAVFQAEGNSSHATGSLELVVYTSNSLIITNPQNGVKWSSKTNQNITWEIKGTLTSGVLFYSTNGGAAWNKIADIYDLTVKQYSWLVPDVSDVMNDCAVKISWSGGDDHIGCEWKQFRYHHLRGYRQHCGDIPHRHHSRDRSRCCRQSQGCNGDPGGRTGPCDDIGYGQDRKRMASGCRTR